MRHFLTCAGLAVVVALTCIGSAGSRATATGTYHASFEVRDTTAWTNLIAQTLPALDADSEVEIDVNARYVNNTGHGTGLGVKVTLGGVTVWGDAASSGVGTSPFSRGFTFHAVLSNEGLTGVQVLAGSVSLGRAQAASEAGVGTVTGGEQLRSTVEGKSSVDTSIGKVLAVAFKNADADPNEWVDGSVHIRVS